ncbi:hypothetical protein VP1G_01403 [Cytospora mali]|uniref:Uncharacterized protein n=1 Tax=Cytospora mali TaxID=578113 RepID=A0A194UQY9_CYTMA|nr:hypothetical protein VP1G_01403 [Valsa mali var. pyri (nom. inval.)]
MWTPQVSSNSLTECPTGYEFYTCAVSNFKGCCSIEPCELLGGCPINDQPGFASAPEPMISSIISSAVPQSTSQSLSSSETTTAVIVSETVTPAPTTAAAAADTTSTPRSPPYSTSSSSSPVPYVSTPPKFNHAGLIAGLVVGFSVVLIITAIILYKLRHHRQIKKVGDDVPFVLLRNLRTKAWHLPRKTAGHPAPSRPPDKNKPVPPVPASAVPWQESFSEAGLLGRMVDDDGRGPTTPNTPASTAGASTTRQPSIRAVPYSPSRAGAGGDGPLRASPRSTSSRGAGGGGGTGAASPGRAASPVDSFFDCSMRRGSELGTSWMDSESEYVEMRPPSEFHGLSAPPRSRNGTSPGSKVNQA